jgi:riboflavin synthase
VKEGDSISVSGACLTAVKIYERSIEFDLSEETMRRTYFYKLKKGDPVNLERAVSASGRFDGHFVTGHIDCVGVIRLLEKNNFSPHLKVEIPSEFLKFCAEKGSIAVDGISLTVAEVDETGFSVALIPYTIEHTNLKYRKPGDPVNVEVDILSRYVARILEYEFEKEKTLRDFLEGRW